ncbi:MAG: histidine phosphatase family protein [Actinomycetota bacterium]|nr:histidine phosphatase family protein [Actinomycetota bacterium]
MGVAELIVVRHGESTANVAREQAEASAAELIAVEARDADIPLSDIGLRQAQSLGRWLGQLPADAAPTAVWSSPYLRARQTAQAAVAAAGSALEIRVDERLRDKELGVLDALTSHGMRARFPAEAERRRWLGKFYYRAPGGESWVDMALRLRSVLLDLDRDEDGQRVLVVTHDAVVMLLRYICERLDEQSLLELAATATIVNTGLTRLVREGRRQWKVADFNRQDHLLAGHAGEDLRTEHPADSDTLPH